MRNDQLNGELPLLTLLKKPAALEREQIEVFGEDERVAVTAAVLWAWRRRRVQAMTQRHAAALCGMKPQHFSLVVSGRKYLPPHGINVFEEVVGNTAVTQTIERFRRLRDERLQRELAELVAETMRRSA